MTTPNDNAERSASCSGSGGIRYETPAMLPCPFCGGPATVMAYGGFEDFSEQSEYPYGSFFTVGCGQAMSGRKPHCQIQPRTHGYITPSVAAIVWNDRDGTR
jgi:hypothetical protein